MFDNGDLRASHLKLEVIQGAREIKTLDGAAWRAGFLNDDHAVVIIGSISFAVRDGVLAIASIAGVIAGPSINRVLRISSDHAVVAISCLDPSTLIS
jgi:hypothetical protein